MDAHAKNLSFMYQGKQIRLAPFYDMMCTNIYKDLSQKLAMKIGGENRPEWIMGRHWDRFAEEIKISKIVLRKRLTKFCLKLIKGMDTTHTNFIKKYQGENLLNDVITTIKKRVDKTLRKFE
jgi:serine/threonine-protein kinase HipA